MQVVCSLYSSHSLSIEDKIVSLLNQLLSDIHTVVLVGKWPIILTSCFFATLLCWDIAGDETGWYGAIWVPLVGVSLPFLAMSFDYAIVSQMERLERLIFSPHPPSRYSLEIVHSSLHISSTPSGASGGAITVASSGPCGPSDEVF